MNIIRFNPTINDEDRRHLLFEGDFLVYGRSPALIKLVEHANSLVRSVFGEEPETAQSRMQVNEFIELASPLKTTFTNSDITKELIKELLVEFNCDPVKTFFDVPRLRIVTSDNFLTSGVGYAYKAHRDTWYSSPEAQVNWWLPVYDLSPENTMSIYPEYWAKKIKNSSGDFNYEEWCRIGRVLANSQTGTDTRKHPLPLEEISALAETRYVLSSAEVMLFSAAHLHATAPNTSGKTRFSIDFRTIHLDDLQQKKGAKNIDNGATGTTLQDFIGMVNYDKIDQSVISSYLDELI